MGKPKGCTTRCTKNLTNVAKRTSPFKFFTTHARLRSNFPTAYMDLTSLEPLITLRDFNHITNLLATTRINTYGLGGYNHHGYGHAHGLGNRGYGYGGHGFGKGGYGHGYGGYGFGKGGYGHDNGGYGYGNGGYGHDNG